MRRLAYHPLAPLLCFSLVLAALSSLYLLAGQPPSRNFEKLASLFAPFLLAYWVVADAQDRRQIPCFDFGLLCYVFLPVAVPWYCFWSRGWRGALVLAAIVGLLLAPYAVALLVWRLLDGAA